jgi:dTDP-glucose pyrophosphorylase
MNSTAISQNLIGEEASVLDAAQALERARPKIVVVTDGEGRLRGTITDGDIRRALLRGVRLDASAAGIMYTSPAVGSITQSRESLITKMKERDIHQIPLLNDAGQVVAIKTLSELEQSGIHNNIVVLLAGGLGTRLRPLTEDCPKPMLKVGGKPLLQSIVERFVAYGFHRFRISVNYKAEMIKDFFGDGGTWGIEIAYIEEEEALGTAGPLGRLQDDVTEPVIVMNGDVLTSINLENMLQFHVDKGAAATVAVRSYDLQVPYGVLELDDDRVTAITEKPVFSFFVNAGAYVLASDVVNAIPKNRHLDMPDLLRGLLTEDQHIGVFPIYEYWMDIGRRDDFDQAQRDIRELV